MNGTQTHDHYTARCPGCKRYMRLYIHHGRVDGQYGYWLACTLCNWTQDSFHETISGALQAYEDMPPAAPAAERDPDPLYTAALYATIAQSEALARMAAAAEKQAADVRAIREVLETLLDTMAAEVQP